MGVATMKSKVFILEIGGTRIRTEEMEALQASALPLGYATEKSLIVQKNSKEVKVLACGDPVGDSCGQTSEPTTPEASYSRL